MRNKIEFENRVREIAAQKKKDKVIAIRNASITIGGLLAACLVLVVFTQMQDMYRLKVNDLQAGEAPPPNYNKGEMYEPMQPDEDAGMDGIMDSENESIHQNNGSQVLAKDVEILIGDEKYALDDELGGKMSSWLDKVKNATPADEYDSIQKQVYEVHYFYDNGMTKIYYISENYIKLDDGEWFEFNQELRDEFDEIVEKCREE